MIGFSSSAISVLEQAEYSVSEADNTSLIHMDVDESFLPMPRQIKAAIFESFSRQNIVEAEIDITSGISQLVSSNYGFATDSKTEVLCADHPLALFSKLVLCCLQEGGTLCFPSGSNGNYVSAAKFLKADVVTIPTSSEAGFKLTGKLLDKVLESVNKPWIYISGPTVNPTGLLYTNEELKDILMTCAKFGARVILDTSFSGIIHSTDCDRWDLKVTLAGLTFSAKPSFCIALLGGLFLKMLTGGLNFGFLLLNQTSLVDAFHNFTGLTKPHTTIRYAVKKLVEQEEGSLQNSVQEQEKILATRYKHLKETLEHCGWQVLEAQAGVSVVAKPSSYLGKTVKLSESAWEAKLDDSNIREAMLRSTGLCINSAAWTGIPGYCRFMIALEESEFEKALSCIVKFHQIVGK